MFDGLNGNVDLGGTWYDPSNDPLPNSQPTASNIPGSYNYDYVTSNGVCPADTALVEVIVGGSIIKTPIVIIDRIIRILVTYL